MMDTGPADLDSDSPPGLLGETSGIGVAIRQRSLRSQSSFLLSPPAVQDPPAAAIGRQSSPRSSTTFASVASLPRDDLIKLLEASRVICNEIDPKLTVSYVLKETKKLLRSDNSVLFNYDASSNSLVPIIVEYIDENSNTNASDDEINKPEASISDFSIHTASANIDSRHSTRSSSFSASVGKFNPNNSMANTTASDVFKLGHGQQPQCEYTGVTKTVAPHSGESFRLIKYRKRLSLESGTDSASEAFRTGKSIKRSFPTSAGSPCKLVTSSLSPAVSSQTGIAVFDEDAFSILAVPVWDGLGNVHAVIKVLNKLQPPLRDPTESHFTATATHTPSATVATDNSKQHIDPAAATTAHTDTLTNAATSTLSNGRWYTEFTEQDESILKHFSLLAGIALRNAALYRDAVSSRDLSEGLLTLLSSLRPDLGVQSALLTLTMHASKIMQVEHCTIYIIDRSTSHLMSISSDASVSDALTPTRQPFNEDEDESILGECARRGEPVIWEYDEPVTENSPSSRHPHPFNAVAALHSGVDTLPSLGSVTSLPSAEYSSVIRHRKANAAVAPIRAENELTIGLIKLTNKRDEDGFLLSFTENDMRVLDMFGRLVGPRMESSDLGLKAKLHLPTEAGKAADVERSVRRPSVIAPSMREAILEEESEE